MKRIVLACALALGSTAAVAQTTGAYLDVNLGVSFFRDMKESDFDALTGSPAQSSKLDDQGTFWSVAAGYRPWSYFSADVGYADLGSLKYRAAFGSVLNKASLTSGGPTVGARGILPIGRRFELYGGGGLMFANTSWRAYQAVGSANASGSFSAKSRDFFVGTGAAFNITDRFAVRLAANRFFAVGDKYETDETDIDTFSVGFTVRQ